MSFKSCPHCDGKGWQGFFDNPCYMCKGTKMIDEQTGKPPENEKWFPKDTLYRGKSGTGDEERDAKEKV